MRKAIICMMVFLLAGCSVGPDYVKPTIVSPPSWRIDYESAANLADTAWWEQFGDPALNTLIETALRENRDLKAAAARVDQFLGVLDTTRSQFFPQFGASASASRQRDTETGPVPRHGTTYDYYQGALNVYWEIDIWGRIRRASESAQAQVLASEEGRRAVVLTLVTSVANSYITLRGLDRQLEIARETEQSYGQSLKLFQLRYKYGTISRVQLSQVESQYEIARQAIPQLESQVRQQENLISVLLGSNPGPIPRGKTIDQLTPPGIPASLPSTLLERRPDIVQAEQNLVSANAEIGVAKALYFPVISLTGLLGTASANFSDLFEGPSKIWSLGGSALMPIYTFGAISGQVKQAEAFQHQSLYQYEQTILNAFREVEDALVATTKGREQQESQGRQVKALSDYARLSRLQYEGGTVSYLQVLDADRSLFSGQLSYVQTQTGVLTSLVNVYKSMGGGWVNEADRLTGMGPQVQAMGPRVETAAK
ncbi:MAG: efflux transporter outer membrane subunit [Desulfuromonadales bacterium]|nr:MAG: efflux transporter outer membrane subunit [Desulfuromonadales bacterium]